MHIDPKAPASSAQHPRNWRKPDFRAPVEPPAAVVAAPPPVEKKKAAPKKATKKPVAADLAAALAELGDA